MNNHSILKKLTVRILIFAFIAINLSPFSVINAFAEVLSYELDENYADSQGLVYTLDEEVFTAEISGPLNKNEFVLEKVIVPNTVNKNEITYTVTSIGESAFSSLEVITSISIGDSIITIGTNAFDGCEGLADINIPDSVENIGKNAFAWCSVLTGFTVGIENSNYSSDSNGILFNKDRTILMQYPMGKTNTEYTIPLGVANIEDYAFAWCASLKNIIVPSSVINIGDLAFLNCLGLTDVTLSSGLKNIGESAFENCKGITKIIIPAGALSIGKNAFKECTSLGNITMSESVVSIGRNAFANTAWYNNQADGVVYISKVAYIYKGSMPADTQMTLLADTKVIADYAFYSCEDLISFKVPSSVQNIGYGVFFYCEGLAEITVETGNVNFVSDNNGALYNKTKTMLIQYPLGNKRTQFTVPAGVKSISERAFYYCSNLSDITFSSGVQEIGESAFEGCVNLKSIILPNNMTNIGDYAFYYCTGLKSITIPKNVTTIGSDAFYECKDLVLYVYDSSYAYEYAVSAGRSYQLLIDYVITLSNGYATGIEDLQTVNDIINKLKTATVKNLSGMVITGDILVGTGCVIYYNSSNYTVVIKGEVNGDGKIDSKDYLFVKRGYLGTYKFSACQLKAACLENTPLPTAKDYFKIKRHFLGTYNLFE